MGENLMKVWPKLDPIDRDHLVSWLCAVCEVEANAVPLLDKDTVVKEFRKNGLHRNHATWLGRLIDMIEDNK